MFAFLMEFLVSCGILITPHALGRPFVEEDGNWTFDHQDSMKRKPTGGWCPNVASRSEVSLRL